MAILWSQSLTPWIDENGDPRSGAKAYFFDAGTTTPRTVYRDGALGQSHDHPVVANAAGMFPAIFLPAGDYRVRITNADGVTVWDVDGITTPSISDGGGGGGGDTPVELLQRVGMYVFRHGTGVMSGWVRANGRTIGNAASGATERANADCENLFLWLWAQDSTLMVTGGRGANAASDWAGSKQISLPDIRLRGLIGMASMGAATSTLIPASMFDNSEDGDTLGATVGASAVALTVDQIPAHDHGGQVDENGAHAHNLANGAYGGLKNAGGSVGGDTDVGTAATQSTATAGLHRHRIPPQGGGQGHPNVQPSAVATCYLKL